LNNSIRITNEGILKEKIEKQLKDLKKAKEQIIVQIHRVSGAS